MKYKVVLMVNKAGGGNPDGMVSLNFYTRNQAENCAREWAQTDVDWFAWLWDGINWNYIT